MQLALERPVADAMRTPALTVQDLSVSVGATSKIALVNSVSIDVQRGEVTALIGESGSGKSLTASAVLGLTDPGVYQVSARSLAIDGVDLSGLREREFARIWGRRVGYIMQDPGTALDPTMTIGDQIAEILVTHRNCTWTSARAEAVRMLDLVRIPSASRRVLDYPQAFSGGMRQRVVIAGAVALEPALLVADEPTTALDVTVQAEILKLIDELRKSMGMGVLLITHDLGVVYQVADQVTVMYAGSVVENGPAEVVCTLPSHPYTAGLLASVPDLEGTRGAVSAIPGAPPFIGAIIEGCAFADRCPHVTPVCRTTAPHLRQMSAGHVAACHNPLGDRHG